MAFSALTHINATSSDGNGITSGSLDSTGGIVIFASVSATGSFAFSDSKSNSWTLIGTQSVCHLYVCFNPTVGTGHTFSVSGSSVFSAISIGVFGGSQVHQDQSNSAAVSGTQTTLATGSITPITQNELLIAICGWGNGNAFSGIDSSFTLYEHTDASGTAFGSALAYQIQTTVVARNPIFTIASPGSATFGAIILSIYDVILSNFSALTLAP